VEDGRARCDEDLFLDGTSHQMRSWANQAVSADTSGMTVGAAHHGVFHDDAVLANLDSTTFGDDRGAVHDSAVGADHDITTDSCRRRDEGARLNPRAPA
jgi:hypothetical protein